MFEIAVSPLGELYLDGATAPLTQDLERKLGRSVSEGLLSLAGSVTPQSSSGSVIFWGEFAGTYLRHLCASSQASAACDDTVIAKFASCVPSMRGAEYVDSDLLSKIWDSLNQHMTSELESFAGGLRRYIEVHFPDWAAVGFVHFHLAESPGSDQGPFAFLATYTTRVSERARVQHVPLGHVVKESAGRSNKEFLLSILSPLKEASKQSSFVSDLIRSKRIYSPQYFSSQEAYQFLQDVPLLEESGVTVKLPRAWHGKAPSRAKVSVTLGDDKKTSFVGFDSMFRFRVRVTVDGEPLSEAELKSLLESEQRLVQIRGKWIEADKDKIAGILDKWQRAERLQQEGFSFAEAMRFLARSKVTEADSEFEDSSEQSWLDFVAGREISDLLQKLHSPGEIQDQALETSLSSGLNATLRPYQLDGVKWLSFVTKLGLGACLADDMGLGKTIQVISLMLVERERGQRLPNLLVVPASLLGNWEGELLKFAPSLSYKVLHPSQTSKPEILSFATDYQAVDLVITTYSLAMRVEWLRDKAWNLVVLDEAQAIKNPAAKQTRAIKTLSSRSRLALTGTPIENNLSDLWSIYDFSCPSLLGKYSEFKRFHQSLKSIESYQPLRKLISPYLLRRKKTDKRIISDLPEKTELKSYCLLTKEQVSLYQDTVSELSRELKAENTDIQRKGLVLSYLLKFKQICNHPSQLLGDSEYDFAKSGKLYRLREIAETIASRGEKMLVFTQFRELTDILAAFLAEVFGRQGFVLHGGTSVKKRRELVELFQSSEESPFFVLSLKAGGTGLNLTRASHVVHFDRWWNPAVENQATDRVFRIGQTRGVMVHKFVCQGTIEERIDMMIDDKKGLSQDVIEGTQDFKFTELSNDELMDMISLDVHSAQMGS